MPDLPEGNSGPRTELNIDITVSDGSDEEKQDPGKGGDEDGTSDEDGGDDRDGGG